jgi:succinate dehydrogenase/fumarate reductase flavoprotein subunit
VQTASAPTRFSTSTCSASALETTLLNTLKLPSTCLFQKAQPTSRGHYSSSAQLERHQKVAVLRKELQDTMDKNAQVYRTEET